MAAISDRRRIFSSQLNTPSMQTYVFITLFWLHGLSIVSGTLTPSGSVAVECGGQQAFTCSVTGQLAGWFMRGLVGIIETNSNGQVAASINARVTTQDASGQVRTSTITIAGFTTADSGGTVSCVDSNTGTTQGTATVSVAAGPPSCPANVTSVAHDDNDAVTVTWSLPPTSPPVTSTTVTYCPTSSPNCGDSQVCTSPCTVRGLTPNSEYRFTVTPANNCGSPSCTGSTATAKTACICPVCSASVTPAILSGVVPSVVLILINIISVAVAVL